MTKYLILGSSGQIGAPLGEYLKNLGHQVLTFDIVEAADQDLRIKDNALLEERLRESDFVFFLAFDVGGSVYLNKYQHTFEFMHNNVSLMCNTFEKLQKYKKPFIFASSQMSNMSHSSYGVCKAVGERYTEYLNGVTVKFWNVYGPEKDLEKAHVITDFILKAKTGTIDMLSDGSESRQFLHVDDCCRCLLALSENYSSLDRHREYHITNFKWHTIMEVAQEIASNFEKVKVAPAKAKDVVQNDKKNEADPYILTFWQPEISLKDGIKDIILKMEREKNESP